MYSMTVFEYCVFGLFIAFFVLEGVFGVAIGNVVCMVQGFGCAALIAWICFSRAREWRQLDREHQQRLDSLKGRR